jgi:hypothetical protein
VKRFTRYWRDREFRAAVDEEFARATVASAEGGWITYGIYDSLRPDPSGRYPGLIIYVGQTKEFSKRVRKRMSDAGRATTRPTDRIDGALYDLMKRGGVPRFLVLDRVTNAIDSFVSETNWAKQLRAEGYPLLNQWTEQRFGGLPIDRYTVPHDWLRRLAVEDALEAGIEIILRKKATGEEIMLDLLAFRPKELLRAVRSGALNRMKELGEAATVRLHVR